ncbi:hypothetical protein ABOONEI_573 [Aciduliprofundum boonei T469]|nr:hypothetical protein ABOONEI_573 [Aciduliprofundum boonei T469]
MYPETDIPPIRISKEHLQKLVSSLPPMPEERVKELLSFGYK